MFSKIIFKPGVVVYDDFNVKPDLPLVEQTSLLKEDLFQVNFADKFLIDVGWYPSFSIDGCFRILIIKDFNWSHPLKAQKTCDIRELKNIMETYVNYVKNVL